MKYLFVHQNFPGQYLHLVRHLAAMNKHEILFLTEENENAIPGVRKMVYAMRREPNPGTHGNAREFEQAMIRAEAVATAAFGLKRLGFEPDVIIGHHGWGELLNLPDVWPDAPLLGYFEFYYHTGGLDVDFDPEFPINPALRPTIRARNTVNLLALSLGAHGQTPTRFQHSTYPDWARQQIQILPEGANLDSCRADPAARREPLVVGDATIPPEATLITYVARNLEPYRGFHVFMRAIPKLLRERPDARIVLVGGDDVSYGARLSHGTWRERLLTELSGQIDLSRVHFPGKIPYGVYRRLLQRSDAHVYLTYPFVASWSLREALAIGCAIVGSDTDPVREFVTHGSNGVLTPCLDPGRLADAVLDLLDAPGLRQRIRAGARRYAERHLDLQHHLAMFESTIRRITRGGEVALGAVKVA
ncbi:MAG: glycosyltransferase family 4 protein [Alphaproteobacteria bacterium]|nr:glycosyltransferase family 4 protein [Alphaproteobacteria bacterium]